MAQVLRKSVLKAIYQHVYQNWSSISNRLLLTPVRGRSERLCFVLAIPHDNVRLAVTGQVRYQDGDARDCENHPKDDEAECGQFLAAVQRVWLQLNERQSRENVGQGNGSQETLKWRVAQQIRVLIEPSPVPPTHVQLQNRAQTLGHGRDNERDEYNDKGDGGRVLVMVFGLLAGIHFLVVINRLVVLPPIDLRFHNLREGARERKTT